MKTLSNPLNLPALPFFFALAFLPSILRLAGIDFLTANSAAAFGPVMAGLWLAAGIRRTGVSFLLLGPFLTTVLGAVNWLMVAGHLCCSTIN